MNKFEAHILVVDDDEGIRDLVKQYLNQNNFLVTTAKSAEDAVEKIKIIKFDLIVLDIMMPGKSGLDFTIENKNNLNTPIILLTAKGQASERVEGLEVGADDYLPKPFEPKELILRIKNILNKTKQNNKKRVVDFGNIKIDLNKHLIFKENKEFKINSTEKAILEQYSKTVKPMYLKFVKPLIKYSNLVIKDNSINSNEINILNDFINSILDKNL